MVETFSVLTPDGISWYCERQGNNEDFVADLVLIPSGEGDCHNFRKTASILANRFKFRVLTFDMPGMSRTKAPPTAYENVTASLLADQIVGLLDHLELSRATFYGCSSGGAVVLALIAAYPSRIQSGIVHEVAYGGVSWLRELTTKPDAEVSAACARIFAEDFTEDKDAWLAQDADYLHRLSKNYPTWARNYVIQIPASLELLNETDLRQRPLTWTIGALTPAGAFFYNTKVTQRINVDLGLLPSKHFPQVTIPEVLAQHIREATVRHL